MTQTHVPNILAVATVLIGSWALISIVDSQRSGGGELIGETKIPMQELEPKVQGGLCTRGSVIMGFYSIFK